VRKLRSLLRRHPLEQHEIKIEGRLFIGGVLPRGLQLVLRPDDDFVKRTGAPFFLGGGVYIGLPVFFEMAFVFNKHGSGQAERHKVRNQRALCVNRGLLADLRFFKQRGIRYNKIRRSVLVSKKPAVRYNDRPDVRLRRSFFRRDLPLAPRSRIQARSHAGASFYNSLRDNRPARVVKRLRHPDIYGLYDRSARVGLFFDSLRAAVFFNE